MFQELNKVEMCVWDREGVLEYSAPYTHLAIMPPIPIPLSILSRTDARTSPASQFIYIRAAAAATRRPSSVVCF